MYKKRNKSKKNNIAEKNTWCKEKLSLSDIICPICLNIMIEPITMPCKHSLCLQCFTKYVSQTSLNCPLCRKRISIWVRKYPKYENLVDKELWSVIQEKFPSKVNARLDGRDESQEYISVSSPKLANPGEIKMEYEKELEMVNAEVELMKQKEQDASSKIIAKIVNEDSMLIEKTKDELNKICEQDFKFAKDVRQNQILEKLENMKFASKSLPYSPIPKGPVRTIDKFLEKSPQSFNHGNTDVLTMTSTPKESGCYQYVPLRRSLNKDSYSVNNIGMSDNSLQNHSENDENSLNQSTPASLLYLSTSTEDASLSKLAMSVESNKQNICNGHYNDKQEVNIHSFNNNEEKATMSTAEDVLQELNMSGDQLKMLIEQQKSYDNRKQQEEDDRILAFQLEKELKLVNRMKGTENEYSLRQTIPKSCKKTKAKKRNRSLNQTTILESFAKRHKPS